MNKLIPLMQHAMAKQVATVLFFMLFSSLAYSQTPALKPAKKGYALVNGVNMYYEIYGSGQPLVLLHGAYSAIGTSFAGIIPELAKKRQVIALELQGHGHTADTDRPISLEYLADDVAGLLRYLKIPKADLLGYSLGAGVALQTGIRHPEVTGKLILVSVSYKAEGIYPQLLAMLPSLTPEMMNGTPWKKEYDSIAPKRENFPRLVIKLKKLNESLQDVSPNTIKAIKAPVMLVIGDADIIRPEHTVEFFRLLGGGVIGDMAGIPNARLAVLPGTSHAVIMQRSSWLAAMADEFLDAAVKP